MERGRCDSRLHNKSFNNNYISVRKTRKKKRKEVKREKKKKKKK
jgi:hypothetical protein